MLNIYYDLLHLLYFDNFDAKNSSQSQLNISNLLKIMETPEHMHQESTWVISR